MRRESVGCTSDKMWRGVVDFELVRKLGLLGRVCIRGTVGVLVGGELRRLARNASGRRGEVYFEVIVPVETDGEGSDCRCSERCYVGIDGYRGVVSRDVIEELRCGGVWRACFVDRFDSRGDRKSVV